MVRLFGYSLEWRDRRYYSSDPIHGPGLGVGRDVRGHGVGLSNTRARLAQLYGERHRIELVDSGDGVTVTIELPLRLAHAETVQAAL